VLLETFKEGESKMVRNNRRDCLVLVLCSLVGCGVDGELPPKKMEVGGQEKNQCKADFALCTSYIDLTAPTAKRSIMAAGSKYSPACVRIKSGQSIQIGASFVHPLAPACQVEDVFEDELFESVTVTLRTTGHYNLYCKIHGKNDGTGMAASIEVVP